MDKQDRNKKNHSPKYMYIIKLLIISIPVVASSILTISFAFSSFKSSTDKNSSEQVAEGSIAIIALAVSVWTGINIANAIEKSEVEKLKQELESAEESIKQLEEKIESSSKRVELVETNALLHDLIDERDFISVLESADDIFFRYISNLYKKEKEESDKEENDKEKKDKDSLEISAEILRIIKAILHIRTLHLMKNKDNLEHIYNYSGDLIKSIDKLLPKVKSTLSKNVLIFMQSEAGYYRGFSRYEYGDKESRYIDTAKIFKDAVDGYIRKRVFFTDGAPRMIESYYDDIIAQCYGEILGCYQASKGNKNATAEIRKIITLEEARAKAKYYTDRLSENLSLPGYPYLEELFNKNCGVIIERMSATHDNSIQSLQKAIKFYEKAAKFGKQRTSGYVLCSAYNKYLRKLISPQETDFITSECNKSLWKDGNVNGENERIYRNICKKLQIQSNRWRQLFPGESLFNYLYLMSQIYSGLIEEDNSKRKKILEDIRPDIEAVKHLNDEPKKVLRLTLINVFENIDKSLKKDGEVKDSKTDGNS